MGVALDPIKLFKQYFWWLAIAGVVGVGVGVVAHFALLRFFPFYRSEVVFEMTSQITEASEITTTVSNSESEIERFIGGQVFVLTSAPLLTQAVNDDPSIRNDTTWAKKYISKQTNLPDTVAMVKDLAKIVGARSVPDSNMVVLHATTHSPTDAATIVKAVKGAYMRQLDKNKNSEASDILESLTSQLNGVQEERRLLEESMSKLLSDNQVTSLDERLTKQAMELNTQLPLVGEIRQNLEVARDQLKSYEEQLASPGGATYPEIVRSQVKTHPVISRFEVQLADLDSALRTARSSLGENNIQTKRLKKSIAAMREQESLERERLLEETFIQLIEMTRSQIQSLEAAEIETQSTIDQAERKLSDLKQVSEDYTNMQTDQQRLADTESVLKTSIDSQRAIVERKASSRVKVQYNEEVPDEPVFPQIIYVVPAVFILIVGFSTGLIVLRELMEQRVRTPQDVALIPRARVVGVIPDASEDPSQPTDPQSAVRNNPAGVIAESVRQIRTNVLKNFAQNGHKSLLIVGGMPGSGASSLISNLASSMAAIDLRVLVIDGNFRRPNMHKCFALTEGPGLGELLMGSVSLTDAIQHTVETGLDVITAGAPGNRVFERLTTTSMSRALDEARASYDIVLLDSPPAIVAGDAMALANRCDAAILVVRAFGEKRGLVSRVRNQLDESRAEVLGVVLNAVRSAAGGYFKRNIRATHEYQNGMANELEKARVRRLEKPSDSTKA